MTPSLPSRLCALLCALLFAQLSFAQADCNVVGGDLRAPDGSDTYLIFEEADRTFTPVIANPDEIAGETQVYVIYEFIFGFRVLDVVDAGDLPLRLPFNADGVFLLSYDGDFPELRRGANLTDILEGKPCADRGDDVRVDEGCTLTVGELAFIDGSDAKTVTVDGDPDPIGFTEVGNDTPDGTPFYLVTDLDTTILEISISNFIDFDALGEGTKLVWLVRTNEANTRGRGLEVGENAADLSGCFVLSNALTVETFGSAPDGGDADGECDVVGGFVETDTPLAGPVFFDDEFDDFVSPIVTNDPRGENLQYVVIDNDDVIQLIAEPTNPLRIPAGTFSDDDDSRDGGQIFLVAYDGELPALAVGNDLFADELREACLDYGRQASFEFDPCNQFVGGITLADGSTEASIVIDTVPDELTFDLDVQTSAPGTDRIVVTDGEGVILNPDAPETIDFNGAGEGVCRVYGLRFATDPASDIRGLAAGENIADLAGCFDLSDNYVTVTRSAGSDPDGGTEEPCTARAPEIAFPNPLATDTTIVVDGTPDPLPVRFDPSQVSGESSAWVITDADLNILGLPAAPPFDLDGAGVGTCLIWFLAFDGELAGAEVGANAADLEGCFELSNPLTVNRVAPEPDTDGACAADAGALAGAEEPVVLGPDGVRFTATVTEEPVVPEGYEVVYVLTTSDELIIQDIYTRPSAYVLNPNVYRLHTLVAELSDPADPDYLDASIIEFGKTPAGAVLDVVAEAGICADLFVAGAPFDVVRPGDGDVCDANAGTISFADGATTATIVVDGTPDPLDVTQDAPAEVSGANAAWVITDADANILGLPAMPPFDLDGAGIGSCLIWYLTWDGELSGAEVGANATELEGCFDLSNPLTVDRVAPDTDGACAADAGALAGAEEPVVLGPDGVRFTATVTEEPTVPEGYEVVYVLTTSDELIIQDIYTRPSGYVLNPNVYRLHTLVAELSDPADPDYLDASIIEFGKTPAGAVLDVIAEAGICADLFVAGAAFDVVTGGGSAALNASSTQLGAGADVQVTLTPAGRAVEDVEVRLVDRAGRVIATQVVGRVDAATTATLDVAGQGEGLYVVSVRSRVGLQSELIRVQ